MGESISVAFGDFLPSGDPSGGLRRSCSPSAHSHGHYARPSTIMQQAEHQAEQQATLAVSSEGSSAHVLVADNCEEEECLDWLIQKPLPEEQSEMSLDWLISEGVTRASPNGTTDINDDLDWLVGAPDRTGAAHENRSPPPRLPTPEGVGKHMPNRQEARYESKRGKYSRQVACDAAGKLIAAKGRRLPHAEYAWLHYQQASNFTLGNPCLESCCFKRQCGKNFTGAILLRAHARVYGDAAPQCTKQPDGSVKYTCGVSDRFTQRRWREVVASSITSDAQNPEVKLERFMVEGVGPVCEQYARCAYGVHSWTWKTYLAAARAFILDVDHEPKDCSAEQQVACAPNPPLTLTSSPPQPLPPHPTLHTHPHSIPYYHTSPSSTCSPQHTHAPHTTPTHAGPGQRGHNKLVGVLAPFGRPDAKRAGNCTSSGDMGHGA